MLIKKIEIIQRNYFFPSQLFFRVFASGPVDRVSIPGRVKQRL